MYSEMIKASTGDILAPLAYMTAIVVTKRQV